LSYILGKILETENVAVPDADVDAHIQKIWRGLGRTRRADVQKWMDSRGALYIRSQMREERLFDFLIQNAKVTETPAALKGESHAWNDPTIIERWNQGAAVGYDIYSRLLRDRIIFIGGYGGAIDTDSANAIIAQLLYLEAEDPEREINLYINSPGGMVTAGLAVYDTMQYIQSAHHHDLFGHGHVVWRACSWRRGKKGNAMRFPTPA
jgi:hypothetical protein